MAAIINGTAITAAIFNGTTLTEILYNGVSIWTSTAFTATWTGGNSTYMYNNTTGDYMFGIETSGSTFRSGSRYYNIIRYGPWATVTTAPVFGSSMYYGYINSYTKGYNGVQGSSSSIRFAGFYGSYTNTQRYTPWATYTIGTGWSGGGSLTQTMYKDKYTSVAGALYLDVSGKSIRWHSYNYVIPNNAHLYGAWITLN